MMECQGTSHSSQTSLSRRKQREGKATSRIKFIARHNAATRKPRCDEEKNGPFQSFLVVVWFREEIHQLKIRSQALKPLSGQGFGDGGSNSDSG
ncbi:hypothetical protein PoB_001413200 [Plakobranchus ocellatus]|uniref:Uncharacterized protein n=1 Tax=Plakobranchus ocellatus TaxID=259542 RepID=A0AAV3YZ74_9GAST|nr:hypothetical protein PoB_001413200 [Plakobranchus ocellatus]